MVKRNHELTLRTCFVFVEAMLLAEGIIMKSKSERGLYATERKEVEHALSSLMQTWRDQLEGLKNISGTNKTGIEKIYRGLRRHIGHLKRFQADMLRLSKSRIRKRSATNEIKKLLKANRII